MHGGPKEEQSTVFGDIRKCPHLKREVQDNYIQRFGIPRPVTGDGPYGVPNATRVYSIAIQRTCGPTDIRIMGPWKNLTKDRVDEKLGAQHQEGLTSDYSFTTS